MPFDNANLDETTRVLIDARGFIERGWCVGMLGQDANGRETDPRSEHASRWCAYGALLAAGMDDSYNAEPLRRLMKAIGDGSSGPAYFNNTQKSSGPVIEAFDRAISANDELMEAWALEAAGEADAK